MRLRIKFSKTEEMRYTSHLDLFRAWERTLRRASLPLAYSQGFKPHPRINLASALPLGFTSSCEIADIWLEQEIPLEQIASALDRASPPGMQISQIQEIDERTPALQSQLKASKYLITFLEPFPQLDKRLEEMLLKDSIPRERRQKTYDLRPLILDAEYLTAGGSGQQRVEICLMAQEGATGRPEEVILALGGEPEKTRVQRIDLIFRSAVVE
jgi:radical SAM-linked protein